MSSKVEKLYTPMSSILLTAGFFLLSVFGIMYFMILGENDKLGEFYYNLDKKEAVRFGTLTEYHTQEKASSLLHIYTYKVSDATGKLHEISEAVDHTTRLRLRIGDSVAVKSGSYILFGKATILARIAGNSAPYSDYSLLKNFSQGGILFSLMLIIAGLFKLLWF